MNGENDKCPYCGGEMRLKSGRYGKFWGCPNFPKCYFTCDSDISYDFVISKYLEYKNQKESELRELINGILSGK